VSAAAMDAVDECGFVFDAVEYASVPGALRAAGSTVADLLRRPELADAVFLRPEPTVWSALEYAGHLRDVFLAQRDRALLALVVDTPTFVPIYRDERVGLARYNDDRPELVAGELVMAADLFARLFERLSAAQLARRCIYTYPAPAERDIGWMGRHTLHEAIHHLADVRRVLDQVAA
jgi:DNA segregation ATPase FtsK/SpoIIIE, S-DNA-T family